MVELCDGRWTTTARGDREQMRDLYAVRVTAYYDRAGEVARQTRRYSRRGAGHAVALFDALNERRDEVPFMPRLDDETRVLWPAEPPGPEGLDAVVWVQPEAEGAR